jgi:hypothetical protein
MLSCAGNDGFGGYARLAWCGRAWKVLVVACGAKLSVEDAEQEGRHRGRLEARASFLFTDSPSEEAARDDIATHLTFSTRHPLSMPISGI